MKNATNETGAGTDLTQRIAAYASEALGRGLPAETIEKTKYHVLDTLGAIVSGSKLRPGEVARNFVEAEASGSDAAIVPGGMRRHAADAAFANAISAHADETDDSHPASVTHPGSAVVPAALAAAERFGATGSDFLTAVALGYDICARTGMVLGAGKFVTEKDFDTHSFGGTLGAAAAAGALAGHDATRMAYVMAYAAQQTAGLATTFGDSEHIEKAFVFSGRPARDGVSAALLVRHGFTAPADTLDGKPSFWTAFRADPAGLKVFDNLGSEFEIMNTNIKRWSVGSPVQAALDSTEALLRDNRIALKDITEIVVRLPEEGAKVVDNRTMPSICAQHLVALMLVDGTVGFVSSHDEERMKDEKVLAMRRLVRLVPDPELSRVRPSRQAIVEIGLGAGGRLSHRTEAVRGTIQNPMSRSEIETKAFDLMTPVLGESASRRAVEAVWALDRAPSLAGLLEPLCVAAQ